MGARRWGGHWVFPAMAVLLLLCSASIGLFIPDTGGEAKARKVLHTFLSARLSRDEAKVRSLLTRRLHSEYVNAPVFSLIGGVDPHYAKYSLQASRQSNGAWIMEVQIIEEVAGEGSVGWFSEQITLVPVESTYLVDSVERGAYHLTQP